MLIFSISHHTVYLSVFYDFFCFSLFMISSFSHYMYASALSVIFFLASCLFIIHDFLSLIISLLYSLYPFFIIFFIHNFFLNLSYLHVIHDYSVFVNSFSSFKMSSVFNNAFAFSVIFYFFRSAFPYSWFILSSILPLFMRSCSLFPYAIFIDFLWKSTLTPLSLTQRCQWHRTVWLSGINDTAESTWNCLFKCEGKPLKSCKEYIWIRNVNDTSELDILHMRTSPWIPNYI